MDGGNWEPKKLSRLNMLMSGISLLQWWKVLHVNGGEDLFNQRTHLLCEEMLSNTNKKKTQRKQPCSTLLSPRSGPFQKLVLNVSSGGLILWTYHSNALT
jgi:hypothetical protein